MASRKKYTTNADRQQAYRDRMKMEAEDARKYAKVKQRAEGRVAQEKASIRNNLKTWINLVGVDGLNAAMKEARRKHHPDVGGTIEDFQQLTDLTEWMKTLIGNQMALFRL